MKLIISAFLFLLPNIIIAQSSFVRGSITARDGKPIENAEVFLSETESPKASSQPARTDKNGIFTLKANRNLPYKYWISIKKNGYDFTPIKLTIKPGAELKLEMAFTAGLALYTLEEAKKILDKLYPSKVIVKTVSTPSANSDKKDNNEEVLKFSSDIEKLKEDIINGKISTKIAESRSTDLLRQVNELQKKLDERDGKIAKQNEIIDNQNTLIDAAYLHIIDCNCESFSKKSLKIGFDVTDRNYEHITNPNKTITFIMEVKKIDGLKGENANNGGKSLFFEATGKYLKEFPVNFPTERIYLEFKTNKNDFFADKLFDGVNYDVNIYNKAFDLPLYTLKINNLSQECFSRTPREKYTYTGGRPVNFSKQIEVRSENIQLVIYDSVEVDEDKISLYLNKNIIEGANFIEVVNKPKIIPIKLLPGIDNELVMFSESSGNLERNTAVIKIMDGEKLYGILKLSSDKSTSDAIRIIIKK